MKEELNKILGSNENDFNKNFLNENFVLYLKLKNKSNRDDDFLKLIDFKAIKFNEDKNGESRSSEYADIDFYDITNEKNFKFGERIDDNYIGTIVNKKLKDYDKDIIIKNLYWHEQLYYEQIQIPKKKYIIEPIDELNKNLVDNKCYFLIRDIDAIYKKNTEKISKIISKIIDVDELDKFKINDAEFEIDDAEFGKMIKDGTFKYIGNYDSSKQNITKNINDYKEKYKFYFSTICDSLLGSIFTYNEKNNEYIINDEILDTVKDFGGKRKQKTHKTHKNKKPKNTKRKHTKKYKN